MSALMAETEVTFLVLKDIPGSVRFEGVLSSRFKTGKFPAIDGKPGGISRSVPLTQEGVEFVSFIRIGDELTRAEQGDAAAGELTMTWDSTNRPRRIIRS